jgi:hypothetical protein
MSGVQVHPWRIHADGNIVAFLTPPLSSEILFGAACRLDAACPSHGPGSGFRGNSARGRDGA